MSEKNMGALAGTQIKMERRYSTVEDVEVRRNEHRVMQLREQEKSQPAPTSNAEPTDQKHIHPKKHPKRKMRDRKLAQREYHQTRH
ncbi:Uncharacterised protein [BD1-7 clade bacterium]|uniref:Uncharacterized protein n=1 Tax=BD1-7 clade bacterium TaxID=2029982 RepID=A0A5S9QTS8_9GAMM|nr:Uncharacterised protein [BD1-7 clade bacterium]CAA0122215.1 Uncharacterised protein [BD1-7 clade bacterium]